MSPRTTGILFLVAAALGAFVYLYEIRGGEQRREAEERAGRLFADVEPEDVAWFELRAQDGTLARVERRERGWQLTQPLVFPADEFAADAVASGLAQLASGSELEDPQAPEVYGLGEGATELRFGAGEDAHELRLGDETPIDPNTYATTGASDAVYTVPTSATQAFRKRLEELREKRILDFDTASVQSLELDWPGGGVSIERAPAGEGWRLTRPLQARGDDATIDALLADLSFLRAEGFVDEPPPDDEAGLDEPELRAEVVTRPDEEGAEPLRHVIAIGQNFDGTSRLVRAGSPSLYRISAERLGDFEREVDAYRHRQLAEFPAFDARRLEIVFHPRVSRAEGSGPAVIEATRGESGWESTPESFRAGKLSRLVSELSRLRAQRVLADSAGPDELAGLGLAPPNVILRAWGEDEAQPLAEVELGIYRGTEGIVARRAGDETVYELDYELAEHVPVSLEAFENQFAAPPAEEAAGPPEAGDAAGEVGSEGAAPEADPAEASAGQ